MKIFITGASGFLGSVFCKLALNKGHSVVALSRSLQSVSNSKTRVQWIEGSLADNHDNYMRCCDALIHFASAGVSPQPVTWEQAMEVNVTQSMALIANASTAGVPKILICGSCFEYGRSGDRYEFIPTNAPLEPIGAYATSKAAFSLAAAGFARTSPSSFILVRPFHIYGEGQHKSNFWPSLHHAAISGADFPMTSGEQVRDFQSVEETAAAIMNTLERWPAKSGHMAVTNLGTGHPITLREFASHWWQRWNAKGKLLFGALPYRPQDTMRFVPELTTDFYYI